MGVPFEEIRKLFQSTRSARSATQLHPVNGIHINVSIHALRKERDLLSGMYEGTTTVFQSTRSARSATANDSVIRRLKTVSIHALRKERDVEDFASVGILCVSIHALRKERDHTHKVTTRTQSVSIHALRKERDSFGHSDSTKMSCFNPRAPQGARPGARDLVLYRECFNPRAPQGARRLPSRYHSPAMPSFNPRAPQGARHRKKGIYKRLIKVSIHALRKERDEA